MKKIEQKVVHFEVVSKNSEDVLQEHSVKTIDAEPIERPNELSGTTYRVKPSSPYPEHALYITINDLLDIENVRRPMEIFINSKDMAHYEWTVALTRVVSFIFRLGLSHESNALMVNELKSVFSPSGGFYPGKGSSLQKGRIVPSLVAAIGAVIEQHLKKIEKENEARILNEDDFSDVEMDYSEDEDEVKQEHRSVGAAAVNLTQCPSCGELSYSKQGGCGVCTSCSFSDCG